jgi:hypothetical protein
MRRRGTEEMKSRKAIVKYFIFKRVKGTHYPGTQQEGPFTWAKAHRVWFKVYCAFDKNGLMSKKQDFHIVKVTTETVYE